MNKMNEVLGVPPQQAKNFEIRNQMDTILDKTARYLNKLGFNAVYEPPFK